MNAQQQALIRAFKEATDKVADAKALTTEARRVRRDVLADLRATGMTWREIADATGMTWQVAQRTARIEWAVTAPGLANRTIVSSRDEAARLAAQYEDSMVVYRGGATASLPPGAWMPVTVWGTTPRNDEGASATELTHHAVRDAK